MGEVRYGHMGPRVPGRDGGGGPPGPPLPVPLSSPGFSPVFLAGKSHTYKERK